MTPEKQKNMELGKKKLQKALKGNNNAGKRLGQFTIDGKRLIRAYQSLAEACRVNKVNKSFLSKCIFGKVRDYDAGCTWKYL